MTDQKKHTVSNPTFREPKSAVEEIETLEYSVPKSTGSVNKWAMKVFGEWQAERRYKKACEEESGSAMKTYQIQYLETNMTAESLNVWLTNFIMEVCKETGE